MKRQRPLALLPQSKPELQVRFGVTRLALFGSTIRDTAGSDSSVDILVAFAGIIPPSPNHGSSLDSENQ